MSCNQTVRLPNALHRMCYGGTDALLHCSLSKSRPSQLLIPDPDAWALQHCESTSKCGAELFSVHGWQDDGWRWLAEGLPNLRTLILWCLRVGSDGQWPVGLANCTQLRSLHLSSSSAVPLPRGRYLDRLTRLEWLCGPLATVPHALAAATALENLSLKIRAQRIVESSVLDSLPQLRSLHIYGKRDKFYCHEDSLLELQRRLPTTVIRCHPA